MAALAPNPLFDQNFEIFQSISTDLATEHEFVLFFVGGVILKPPLKAATQAGFVSSLASFDLSLGCGGLPMC